MLKIVGFGSGAKDNMTLEASAAISSAQLIVGYSTYVDILKQYFPDKEYYSTNMMQEKERCQYAIDMAKEGRDVVLVCVETVAYMAWRVWYMNLQMKELILR